MFSVPPKIVNIVTLVSIQRTATVSLHRFDSVVVCCPARPYYRIVVLACITLTAAAGTFVDEDYTLVEGQTSAPTIKDGEFEVEFVLEEEPTTKKPAPVTRATTTAKPVAVVDAVVEAAVVSAPKTRKSSNRPRTSGNRRKSTAKPKVVVATEEENIKAESTSPASLDTAAVSILAPVKNFKPTPKPLDDFQQTSQGLMEFLKKRNHP